MNDTLYLKCKRKGFVPAHTAEVGVYMPQTSNILGFIKDGTRTTLVEPLPECIGAINEYFSGYPNVTLYPYAIAEENGEIELYRAESSTFAGSLSESPAIKNDSYVKSNENILKVTSQVFSEIDDGTIDLISIDTEGSEWFVLKHMRSMPKVISVEMETKYYVNPYYNEILEWMSKNHYEKWYKEKSDVVFIKKNLFKLTFIEKLKNIITL